MEPTQGNLSNTFLRMKILTFTLILINLFECLFTVNVLPNNGSALNVPNGQEVGNDTLLLIDQVQNEFILANQSKHSKSPLWKTDQ